jgi:hypothetical protein
MLMLRLRLRLRLMLHSVLWDKRTRLANKDFFRSIDEHMAELMSSSEGYEDDQIR